MNNQSDCTQAFTFPSLTSIIQLAQTTHISPDTQ